MRTIMKVSIPVESGNAAIEDGSLPATVMAFVDQMKPEAVYFFAESGRRTGLFVFDLQDPTMIPTIAEPFFMKLGAAVEMHPTMNLEEMKAGVAKAMSKRTAPARGAQAAAPPSAR